MVPIFLRVQRYNKKTKQRCFICTTVTRNEHLGRLLPPTVWPPDAERDPQRRLQLPQPRRHPGHRGLLLLLWQGLQPRLLPWGESPSHNRLTKASASTPPSAVRRRAIWPIFKATATHMPRWTSCVCAMRRPSSTPWCPDWSSAPAPTVWTRRNWTTWPPCPNNTTSWWSTASKAATTAPWHPSDGGTTTPAPAMPYRPPPGVASPAAATSS